MIKKTHSLKAVWLFCVLNTLSAGVRAQDSLVLADQRSSGWTIVLASPDEQTRFAAEELQRYIEQICGARLPLLHSPAPSHNIHIGLRNDMPSALSTRIPVKDGFDGYAVAVLKQPAAIIVAGDNRQGVIYGAYDLLEQLGCRWFYPKQDIRDKEVVPAKDRLSVAVGKYAVASPLRHRVANGSAWYFDTDYNNAIQQLDWAMKNRYNMVGWQAAASNSRRSLLQQYKDFEDAGVIKELQKRGMTIHGPAHSFDQFLRTEDYFEQHPEWFGLRDGKRSPQSFLGAQFCWSNAAARKQFVTNAVNFITQAPQIKIFCTIPFDGGIACACDECKKQGSSNLLMILAGELVEQLKTSRPDVLVETIGGYGPVEGPPSDLSVIHPDQRIIWAQWGRYHGVGYDDAAYDSRNLESWRKAAKGDLIICQYYTDNFAEPWILGPFTKAIESDRRYFLKHNIRDLYMLMWAPGYWWNHSLNGYIAGRCFYDSSLSANALLEDYAMHYYGEKAGPLLHKYYSEWAAHIDLSYHLRSGATTSEDGRMLSAERKDLIDPAVAAAAGDKLYAYRVAKVEKLHGLAEMLWQSYHLRRQVQHLREKGKFADAGVLLEQARQQTDRVMKKFYELANLNQGLIDKNEVPGFIQSSIKNWIDEEAVLIGKEQRAPAGTFDASDITASSHSSPVVDTFTIANVLQSHMVVQQGQPFRIWGSASPGATLNISATWTSSSLQVTADPSGRWIGEIPVPLASRGNFTAHRLSVVSGKDTAVLEDLLIGEVWICTGQSNMTFMLDSIPGWSPGVPGFREEVAAANYPYIRLIKIGTALEETPQEEAKGDWKPCTPQTVGGFSAVGYFFGKRLFDSLQVPVGLVSNGIPAAACQSFTDRNIMETNPALRKKYIEPFQNKPRDEKEHIITTLLRPSLIYNGMIYPLRDLSIRGFLWYQGEGNREDGELYTQLCSAMLQGWRKDFRRGDLPFYFVQMPPYIIRGEDSLSTSYARFREHQAAMLSIHNTGMVVIMDVGDPYDIHPRNKKPVGERLAGLALHNTYQYRNISYRGPEFSSFRTEGAIVKISFRPATTAGGLRTIDGLPPEHFYVAGEDHVFHKATARIAGREVWLRSDAVTRPVSIRYAFTNAPMTNFCNSAGLPAAPFRTDKWDK